MKTFKFIPKGICAREFEFEVEDTIVKSFKSVGGCPGNLLGINELMKDKDYKEIIEKFEHVKCGTKTTSCPEQITIALKEFYGESK